MTTLLARPPLQELSMSKVQSGPRRQSARLQQREDSLPPTNGDVDVNGQKHNQNGNHVASVPKAKTSASNPKKRKARADEDDDGFKFSRVKKQKPLTPPPPSPPIATADQQANANGQKLDGEIQRKASRKTRQPPRKDKEVQSQQNAENEDVHKAPKQTKRRMSFSTPTKKDTQPTRRSKRLSTDSNDGSKNPATKVAQPTSPVRSRDTRPAKHKLPAEQPSEHPSNLLPSPAKAKSKQPASVQDSVPAQDENVATKISLPFADTPVISRNKAMRQGKSTKGERRSSLGLRGRRASSLIDTGTSNGKLFFYFYFYFTTLRTDH